MNSRAGLALAAVLGLLSGCATPAPPAVAPVVAPVERAAPAVVPPPAPAPLVEYPPLEPIEPRVEPDAAPAPVAPAAPAATAPEPVPEPAAPPATTEPTEEQQLASLLSDLQRYGAMNADEIRREQNVVTQQLSRQRTDFIRIRLAVLYTLSKTPQDDQRAMQLLDIVVKNNPGSPAARQLAAVLQVQVAERMRAVRDEQQKADAAVKKLEALRNMERDLLRDRIRSGGGGGGGGGSSGGGGGGGGG
jgi:hypothetical protein